MKKSAFTMLELVFVIVVAGILAAVFIPRFERDNVGEAAFQIARHIRLAQHHALVEDRFNLPAPATWQASLWRITFVKGSSGECYNVWANRNAVGSEPAADERAIDPLTRQYLWGGTSCSDTQAGVNDDILLWKSFGVDTVSVCGVATSAGGVKHIAFDHLGRPGQINGNAMNYLVNNCDINITTNDGHSAAITVYKETGFVKVASIDGVTVP